jgi:hypothetical protein
MNSPYTGFLFVVLEVVVAAVAVACNSGGGPRWPACVEAAADRLVC